MDGLSRLRGPLGSVDKLVGGTFDPKSFFGEAKLLGGVSLADLIDAVGAPTRCRCRGSSPSVRARDGDPHRVVAAR